MLLFCSKAFPFYDFIPLAQEVQSPEGRKSVELPDEGDIVAFFPLDLEYPRQRPRKGVDLVAEAR